MVAGATSNGHCRFTARSSVANRIRSERHFSLVSFHDSTGISNVYRSQSHEQCHVSENRVSQSRKLPFH